LPTYRFLNTETGDEHEEFMSISARETYLAEHPELVQMLNGAPAIGDSIRMGIRKPDDAFRDRLREIKKSHSGGITKSTINTR